jgi:hypothetical protein
MASLSDPALHDPRRAFNDKIFALANEADKLGMTGKQLVDHIRATSSSRACTGRTTMRQMMEVIRRANPAFDAGIDVVDDDEPMPNDTIKALIGDVTSPSQLKAMLDNQYNRYIDQLLTHYIDDHLAQMADAA